MRITPSTTTSPAPLVTILTYCAHPALAYGTMLVFKTLRTGFPTARIEVYDNGSHPEVRAEIEQAAADVGASFHAIQKHYANHYEWLLLEREIDAKQLVILDPDVIFWENVEGWDFGDALMAGRLIPGTGSELVQVRARLHPSLFWVSDWAALRHRILDQSPEWDFVGPRHEFEGKAMAIMDTLAPLYQKMPEACFSFQEAQLDGYDHLFNGSHMPILDMNQTTGFEAIRDGHKAAASGDLSSLRGIWRRQEEYFTSKTRETKATTDAQRQAGLLPSAKAVQEWQGLDFSDEQLGGAMQGLLYKLALHMKAPRKPLGK